MGPACERDPSKQRTLECQTKNNHPLCMYLINVIWFPRFEKCFLGNSIVHRLTLITVYIYQPIDQQSQSNVFFMFMFIAHCLVCITKINVKTQRFSTHSPHFQRYFRCAGRFSSILFPMSFALHINYAVIHHMKRKRNSFIKCNE